VTVTLPSVTAIVAVYDNGPFIGAALESALTQDYAGDVDVVVVDDGSTDETAEVVARYVEAYPAQVRYFHQANAGNAAATNVALEHAHGDLIGVLDADDAWPQGKLRAQVPHFDDPGVGLVYGDLTVIDVDDNVVHESLFGAWGMRVLTGRGHLGSLMAEGNVGTGTSLMFRRSMVEHVRAMPHTVPWADFWFVAKIAEVAAIDFCPASCALYRLHETNTYFGATGARKVREEVKGARMNRMVLSSESAAALSPAELVAAWRRMHLHANQAVQAAGAVYVDLELPTDADRAAAQTAVAEAKALEAAGAIDVACVRWCQAAARNPYDFEARERMERFAETLAAQAALPDALADARARITVADAAELLADPDLLRAYAAAVGPDDDATLAIHAAGMAAGDAAAELQGLFARIGLDEDRLPDMLLVPDAGTVGLRTDLRRRASQILSRRPAPDTTAPVVQGPAVVTA
jgi:hypothetical protein